MRTVILVILSFILTSTVCHAEDSELQAKAFHQMYASLCAKNIHNLAALKEKIKDFPSFPPEQASKFLGSNSGSAWPVPDKAGLFVLSLPDNKNQCAIFARRASAIKVEEQFINFVASAPTPLLVRKISDSYAKTASNGETHTIAYEWYVENAKRKFVFTLTTSKYENAEIQALGSIAIVSE